MINLKIVSSVRHCFTGCLSGKVPKRVKQSKTFFTFKPQEQANGNRFLTLTPTCRDLTQHMFPWLPISSHSSLRGRCGLFKGTLEKDVWSDVGTRVSGSSLWPSVRAVLFWVVFQGLNLSIYTSIFLITPLSQHFP